MKRVHNFDRLSHSDNCDICGHRKEALAVVNHPKNAPYALSMLKQERYEEMGEYCRTLICSDCIEDMFCAIANLPVSPHRPK